ncbi:Flp family type IVb pilin [Thermotalea metallivorans]|uniref:Flp/Fap pilin component n=1 Tax=Thermotalea metallivorans TaxID=520762 RepID=A0A140L9Y2_9FIRM|nr:hypothetical protein [Thermotalea metallivorans]KXG77357.1 hypothetical protein AN619_04830 [Thermotalea metallivorans]
MLHNLKLFFIEEEGQGLSEYGIIGAIAAVACVGGMMYLLPKIRAIFNKIGSELDSGSGTTY